MPTLAYSGEVDKQKQAADVMPRDINKVGLELTHIIGPTQPHNDGVDGSEVAFDRGAALYAVRKVDGKWARWSHSERVLKGPGRQGPIDDAFMDRFLMVRPTGTPLNEKVGSWAAGEMRHAVEHW